MSRPSVTLFYSYRREEKEDCLERLLNLVDRLEHLFQFQHQIDENVARLGKNYQHEILQAMKNADIIVLLLTAEYMKSEDCQWEQRKAIELSRQRPVVVIPVLGRDFETWRNDEDLKRMTLLPKDGRFSIKTLLREDESKYFLEPLEKALRDLPRRPDPDQPSRPSNTNAQRDARRERIRKILWTLRQGEHQPEQISSVIDALDDDNLAIRKEVTNELRMIFRSLDQKELKRTLESARASKGLIRFIGTLEPEERSRVKIAVREIQERELQYRDCLFSEGLVEILCSKPTVEDVYLLEKLFSRATPEFQKDILRALPASAELPAIIERLSPDIHCTDVRRVAMTRTGKAPNENLHRFARTPSEF